MVAKLQAMLPVDVVPGRQQQNHAQAQGWHGPRPLATKPDWPLQVAVGQPGQQHTEH